MSGSVCDACKWDGYIPGDYGIRERYRFDPIWGHENATQRPPLGMPFLDERRLLLQEMVAMANRKPRMVSKQSWYPLDDVSPWQANAIRILEDGL